MKIKHYDYTYKISQKLKNLKFGLRFFLTRKPCYRKDDCVMRPIYGCPEKIRESLATPTATFPEIVNGLFFFSVMIQLHKVEDSGPLRGSWVNVLVVKSA